MKKIIAAFLLVSTFLSLVSCNLINGDRFDIAETKKITLGKEVDSVSLTIGGEEVTFDYSADFYEIFDKVSFGFDKDGRKYSYIAEMRLDDESLSYVNMNVYCIDNGTYYESRSKKDGEAAFASIDEYFYSKYSEEDKTHESKSYGRYIYMDDMAIGGIEYGTNGNTTYSTGLYPLMPNTSSEMGKLYIRSCRVRNLVTFTAFFDKFENGEGTKDLNELVDREYKLYKNYIVFKQTATVLNLPIRLEQDPDISYALLSNSDYSITQEAYYNLKTGEFDLVKMYGKSVLTTYGEYMLREFEIDMSIYLHSDAEAEGTKKLNKFIDHVKTVCEKDDDE